MELKTAIQEIKTASAFSDETIAKRLETTQPTITRIRTGKSRGSYDTGKKIIELHAEICGSP